MNLGMDIPQKELNNNEVWRYEYRQKRYMQYITGDELKIRFDCNQSMLW